MEENMMDLYKNLSLSNQRNELNLLLMKMDDMLNILIAKKDLQDTKKVKNYDINTDSNLSEKEMLVFFYEDIWNLKNKIISLLVSESNEN